MERITAERLVRHLQRSGFVIMKAPAAAAPATANRPPSVGWVHEHHAGPTINAVTVQALQADACRDHPVVGWVVMRDQPEPGLFIARLVTDAPTSYVLWADRLAGIQAQLPSGPVRANRQPAEPPDLVEIWFAR